jgi:hypothetical protein
VQIKRREGGDLRRSDVLLCGFQWKDLILDLVVFSVFPFELILNLIVLFPCCSYFWSCLYCAARRDRVHSSHLLICFFLAPKDFLRSALSLRAILSRTGARAPSSKSRFFLRSIAPVCPDSLITCRVCRCRLDFPSVMQQVSLLMGFDSCASLNAGQIFGCSVS